MTAYNPTWNDGTWDIPSWTAQNMAYPPTPAVNGTPSVPYAYVYGTFLSGSGQNANGVVTLTPSVRTYVYNDVITELDPIRVQIISGQIGLNIPAPTAATVPTSWTWDIRLRIGPTTIEYRSVSIAAGTTLDLAAFDAANPPTTTSGSGFGNGGFGN